MASELGSGRFKSTSDILEELTIHEEKIQEDFHTENRFRTYTFKDLREEKRHFTKNSARERTKSQNFLKKWIASFERKNEACKAEDEFFTKYYRRNDYSNPNSDYSFDARSQDPRERRETHGNCQLSLTRTNKRFFQNHYRYEWVSDNKLIVSNNEKIKQFSIENGKNNNEEHLNTKSEIHERTHRYSNCTRSHRLNSQYIFSVNSDTKTKKFSKVSSLESNRPRDQLYNCVDLVNSRRLRNSTNDLNRDTLERIFTNSKEEDSQKLMNESSKKKPGRKRSFKNILGSMIKWKRSNKKEKPRHFMSCDHLTDETTFDTKNVISRTSSLWGVVLEVCEEEALMQSEKQKATIRPVYRGKRNEQLLEVFARNKENRKFFAMNRSIENLVRPPAIKDIAKHLSQLPENAWANGRKIAR
ncbi:PREDICTED: uncharacterized protein LOC107192485 [Dufourea novaeangliae]|uniref:Uncharacterized protein n=1 Tax=Dufourea novaeangliae TaxID=178035 RepID=A0A154PR08_DUFNO|nr:PREDICTED: uncharacterized protein LOC107192485 [Dufourea novaeangliae]KZC14339.1 hypothetical protein WN55_06771 [Dufourea novaeangliae]